MKNDISEKIVTDKYYEDVMKAIQGGIETEVINDEEVKHLKIQLETVMSKTIISSVYLITSIMLLLEPEEALSCYKSLEAVIEVKKLQHLMNKIRLS